MTILDTSIVVIGDRVMFGPNVSIFSASHATSVLSRKKLVEFGHPVSIGNDCWIGGNVIILPGVTIGEGCTIGAGSIVTKDVPPFSVAFGSPCRVQKAIPSAEEEEKDPRNPYRAIDGKSSMY
jgi:acetyltransferase-like isoleucine patch superfamily enzyme